MIATLTELLHAAITSPWVYLALFAAAALDGLFPVVPSESLVVAAGVFAVSGTPDLPTVVVVAAAGAFVGDQLCYRVGRAGGSRVVSRLPDGSRRRAAVARADRALRTRGGLMLVVCRFLPGMRTATTVTAGATGYPPRRFAAVTALAAPVWAVYCAAIGFVGGTAFERDPLLGVLVGVVVAVSLAGAVEGVRYAVRRGRDRATTRSGGPRAAASWDRGGRHTVDGARGGACARRRTVDDDGPGERVVGR